MEYKKDDIVRPGLKITLTETVLLDTSNVKITSLNSQVGIFVDLTIFIYPLYNIRYTQKSFPISSTCILQKIVILKFNISEA